MAEDRAPGGRLDVSSQERLVGYLLRRAQLNIFKDFIARFEGLGLRPALYSTLCVIRDNPGRRQSEVAEVLGIKRANFVTLSHELERRGLVERRKSPTDRRSHALYLSPAGETLLGEAECLQRQHEARVVAALGGPEQRDHLLELLGRIAGADLDAGSEAPGHQTQSSSPGSTRGPPREGARTAQGPRVEPGDDA